MQQENVDQALLDSRRVNPNDPQDVLSQALRIAAYDEFEAYNMYNNVLMKFGNVLPFANIINSEITHYNEIITIMQRYGIEPPLVSQAQVDLPNTLQECCELAIADEIDNIAMYDNLLMYVNEPDVRDVFYRVQAASFNNHLPVFRNCVASHYNQANQAGANPSNMLDNMATYQTLIEDAMNGNVDQNKIMSMMSNMNMSMIAGLALGALGGITASNLVNKNDEEEE